MDKLKVTLVTFVWQVCLSLFGQNGGIMQIVRTSDQIGFLLEEPNSTTGFFTDAFILEFKEKGKNVSYETTVENVQYVNHTFDGTTFEISYIDSKSEKKEKIYAINKEKNGIRLKHETGRLFLRDALSKKRSDLSKKKDELSSKKRGELSKKKKDILAQIGRITPSGRNCSCSHMGSSCQVSCPRGTSAVCHCDDYGSSCFCEGPPVISPNESEQDVISEEVPILTSDPVRIAVAPTLVHSSVNFIVKNGGNTTYYIEIFNLHGNKVIAKQILSEKLDLLDQQKGIYFYTITGDDGYLQKGKIMKI